MTHRLIFSLLVLLRNQTCYSVNTHLNIFPFLHICLFPLSSPPDVGQHLKGSVSHRGPSTVATMPNDRFLSVWQNLTTEGSATTERAAQLQVSDSHLYKITSRSPVVLCSDSGPMELPCEQSHLHLYMQTEIILRQIYVTIVEKNHC